MIFVLCVCKTDCLRTELLLLSLSHYLPVSSLQGVFEDPSGDLLPMISLPPEMREIWVRGTPSSSESAWRITVLNPVTGESKNYKVVQQEIILQNSFFVKDVKDLSFPLLYL